MPPEVCPWVIAVGFILLVAGGAFMIAPPNNPITQIGDAIINAIASLFKA